MSPLVLGIFFIGAPWAFHLGMTEGLLGSIVVSLATLIVSFIGNCWHHLYQFDHRSSFVERRSRFWHGVFFVGHALIYFYSYSLHVLFRGQYEGIQWNQLWKIVPIDLGAITLVAEVSLATLFLIGAPFVLWHIFQARRRRRLEQVREWYAQLRRDHSN